MILEIGLTSLTARIRRTLFCRCVCLDAEVNSFSPVLWAGDQQGGACAMSRNRIGMGWQFWAFITVVAMGMASGAWAQQAPATAKSAEQEKAAASEPQWSNSLLSGVALNS